MITVRSIFKLPLLAPLHLSYTMSSSNGAKFILVLILFLFCGTLLLQPEQTMLNRIQLEYRSILSKTFMSAEPLLLRRNRHRWSLLEEKYARMSISWLWTKRPDFNSSGKTLIFRCKSFCGGLGDRLRGIMTSYILALVTDRHFMIDMTHPIDIHDFLSPNLHNWT